MNKNGPFSVAEMYYIESHAASKSAKEIATDLKRSLGVINKYIAKKGLKTAPVNTEGDVSKMAKADDLLVKNERYGAVAMTKEASTLGDESRKAHKLAPRMRDCIAPTRKPDA